MTRARALWLMAIVLLVAAALRLPQLETTPPGLHYDEAANAILAEDIGLGGERPVFIPSYTGKEVLFFYVAGTMMRVLGSSVFALRLTSAWLGLLTIAATYWLGRELLADRRVAVIAAALLAVSFWHLVFSRLGFRAISQPLLQALAVAALFRGLQRTSGPKRGLGSSGGWRWFVLSGVFLGLTAYTYLAARLFPVPLLLSLAPLLVQREGARCRLGTLVLVGLVAVVVMGPLLLYFVQNPEAFWVRIGQVAPGGAQGEAELSPVASYGRSLGMFFLSGDPYWRFNIPGRPLFSWFWGGLLLAGGAVALLRWRRWWYDWQKSAVLLLVSVPLLMVLPTALATGEIVPSNLRAIGLLPFIFFLPALGLVTLIEQLADLVRRPGEQLTAFLRYLSFLEGYDVNYAFFVLLILLLGGAFTWRSYFEEWAQRTDLFYDSDADLAAVAAYLDQAAPPEAHIYVAAAHARHPTLAFLSETYDRVLWLVNSQALAFPPQGATLYVFPYSSPEPAWAESFLAGARRSEGPRGPDGEPLFTTAFLAERPNVSAASQAGVREVTGTFGDGLQPMWVQSSGGVDGEMPAITLAWRVLGPEKRSLRLFAHVHDLWGHRWGQRETLSYPVDQWRTGDVVLQHVPVPMASGAPPGRYALRVGFFDDGSGQNVPRLDEAGRFAGEALVIEDVVYAPGAPPIRRPQAPRGRPQVVREGLELLGYGLGSETVATGTALPLDLWWWAREPQPPMTVRLELLRADDSGVVLQDTRPAHGTYPFEIWQTPAFVRDVIDPKIPLNLAPGDYRLHLRLLDSEGATVFTSSLGTVSVEATERTFEAPALERPLAASFADEIALFGYELGRPEAGQDDLFQVELTLGWQALQEMGNDYTVFVHVLYPDGQCCAWQSDAMPRQGLYPTSRWLTGEVVVDRYTIEIGPDIAAGSYPLEVGLYLAASGRRLQLETPGREADDALLLAPIEVE